jgi:hypothetical protein
MRLLKVRLAVVVGALAAAPVALLMVSSPPARATWCPVSVGVGVDQPKQPQPVGGCVQQLNTSTCTTGYFTRHDNTTGHTVYENDAECGPQLP